ncbi:MAG: GntR family transcriptional regulator [Eubacteriales bacterium]
MIQIDYQDRRPIYEQIVEKIQVLIFKGVLESETQLPSVRKMAIDLSINPNTIQKAYNQLEMMGLIYSVKGRGSYISPNLNVIDLQIEKYFQELDEVVVKGFEKGLSLEEILSQVEVFYGRIEND